MQPLGPLSFVQITDFVKQLLPVCDRLLQSCREISDERKLISIVVAAKSCKEKMEQVSWLASRLPAYALDLAVLPADRVEKARAVAGSLLRHVRECLVRIFDARTTPEAEKVPPLLFQSMLSVLPALVNNE